MNRQFFRRAVSLEYAIVLMAVVLTFTALLLTLALSINNRSADYSDYLAQKQVLDELGDAFLDGERDLEGTYAEQIVAYSLIVEEGENSLTVCRKKEDGTAGSVLLTVITDGEGNCSRYVYGKS